MGEKNESNRSGRHSFAAYLKGSYHKFVILRNSTKGLKFTPDTLH